MGTWTFGTRPPFVRKFTISRAVAWEKIGTFLAVLEWRRHRKGCAPDPETAGTEVEMSGYRFSAYVFRDGEGWVARCPDFPDCRALGTTCEAALANLRDAIQIFVEDGFGDDELPPHHEDLSFTTLSLSV